MTACHRYKLENAPTLRDDQHLSLTPVPSPGWIMSASLYPDVVSGTTGHFVVFVALDIGLEWEELRRAANTHWFCLITMSFTLNACSHRLIQDVLKHFCWAMHCFFWSVYYYSWMEWALSPHKQDLSQTPSRTETTGGFVSRSTSFTPPTISKVDSKLPLALLAPVDGLTACPGRLPCFCLMCKRHQHNPAEKLMDEWTDRRRLSWALLPSLYIREFQTCFIWKVSHEDSFSKLGLEIKLGRLKIGLFKHSAGRSGMYKCTVCRTDISHVNICILYQICQTSSKHWRQRPDETQWRNIWCKLYFQILLHLDLASWT